MNNGHPDEKKRDIETPSGVSNAAHGVETHNALPSGTATPSGASGSKLRRRLIRGALGATPVILTLRGQSALAANCASPSRVLSGNLSPGRTPGPCTLGRSPGYWKVCQYHSQWTGATVGTPISGYSCTTGSPNPTKYTNGTKFGGMAPFVGVAGTLANIPALTILADPTGVASTLSLTTNQVQLARHLIATYLNFKKFGNPTPSLNTFPVTLAEMTAMFQYGSLNAYCPPTGTGCSNPWTACGIIDYLKNYTMDPSFAAFDYNC